MLDAPLHFPEGVGVLPSLSYGRWFAIYEVDVTSEDAANLVSVCSSDDGTAAGLQGHLEEYFEATQ